LTPTKPAPTAQCNLWLPTSQIRWLDQQAASLQISRSAFVRQFLSRLMANG